MTLEDIENGKISASECLTHLVGAANPLELSSTCEEIQKKLMKGYVDDTDSAIFAWDDHDMITSLRNFFFAMHVEKRNGKKHGHLSLSY